VPGVVLDVDDGTITAVSDGVIMPPPDATTLSGITLPGFVNAHSHVFHRALRARTHAATEDFWGWRDAMYDVAASLDPDSLYALARATYAEMALAGITTVGEFHYLHHGPGGEPYADPNVMSSAVIAAAQDVGIRVTLLDTLYLRGGHDEELSPVQRRFSDGSPEAWAERTDAHRSTPGVRHGAAIHSTRAVRRDDMAQVVDWAHARGAPLHAHVSEQPAENAASHAEYGRSPTHVFADTGALDEHFTAVHATHLDEVDVELLANATAMTCICPTTERELADGIGDTGSLTSAGVGLCLGTDSHAIVDMNEEMRAVELHQRLATGRRGTHEPVDLLDMATLGGARSLGWPEVGRLAAGGAADFVTVDLASVRMAGTDVGNALDAVVFAAAGSDITTVVVAGEMIVTDGAHVGIDAASELRTALESL
jgi:formiminoglutamate deiminase